MLIDNFNDEDLVSILGSRWSCVSDKVMGGISEGFISHDVINGRPCLRMTGDVRLENEGGFIQAALDMTHCGDPLDASVFSGLRITVLGNNKKYSVHLRTLDNVRPRRIGLVAIGRAFYSDLAISELSFYRKSLLSI
jgi:hypothetical protein